MMKSLPAVLLLLGWQLLSCTPSPFRFSLSNSYTREYFSGRDVGGHTFGICPLLTDRGPVTGTKLPSATVVAMVRKERPGLQVREADSVHTALLSALSGQALERYYNLLYKGEIVSLQNADSLWKAVGTDYLLVIRLRHGMDIRTFNQMSRKRINLEAELWDCPAMETVWRVSVLGTCNRAGFSDQKFLIEAIRTIVDALPSPLPSYDTKPW